MRMCERKLLRELKPRLQSVHLSLPGTTLFLTRSGLNLYIWSSAINRIRTQKISQLVVFFNNKQRGISLELIFPQNRLQFIARLDTISCFQTYNRAQEMWKVVPVVQFQDKYFTLSWKLYKAFYEQCEIKIEITKSSSYRKSKHYFFKK